MQIDRKDAIGAGDLDHVGNQSRGDWYARLIFLVATPIGEVGDNRRDAPWLRRGGRSSIIIQELHQSGVHRCRDRLDDEDVALPDVFLDLNENVFVAELEYLDSARRARPR